MNELQLMDLRMHERVKASASRERLLPSNRLPHQFVQQALATRLNSLCKTNASVSRSTLELAK